MVGSELPSEKASATTKKPRAAAAANTAQDASDPAPETTAAGLP
jgi:hypothetical protein